MTESDLTCKFCQKSFRRVSTLSVHLCEQKRRWQQKDEQGVRFGFQAYLQFYTMLQGSVKNRDYTAFAESPYYSAFVKFGQYLVQIRAINVPKFTDWVIKNNKKLDQWTKEAFYTEYLFDHLRHEHPTDALERSLTEMQIVADELKLDLIETFDGVPLNKLCQMVINGRISPWVIYNCKTGTEFLSRLNAEQIAMIYPFIDPEFWDRKFTDYVADTDLIKAALDQAGL